MTGLFGPWAIDGYKPGMTSGVFWETSNITTSRPWYTSSITQFQKAILTRYKETSSGESLRCSAFEEHDWVCLFCFSYLPLDSVIDSVIDSVTNLVPLSYVYIEGLVLYRIDRVLILHCPFDTFFFEIFLALLCIIFLSFWEPIDWCRFLLYFTSRQLVDAHVYQCLRCAGRPLFS